MSSHYPKRLAETAIRTQFHVDQNICPKDNPLKLSCRSNVVVLAKKGASKPMRFLNRLGLLWVLTLTLGLFCSAFAELISLEDDTSNDFVTSTPAQNLQSVQTVRQEANPPRAEAPKVTFSSLFVICCTQPALPSGLDLLRLLSIQRK
jgi:hypothetical protein